jgi:hypothetical protein
MRNVANSERNAIVPGEALAITRWRFAQLTRTGYYAVVVTQTKARNSKMDVAPAGSASLGLRASGAPCLIFAGITSQSFLDMSDTSGHSMCSEQLRTLQTNKM